MKKSLLTITSIFGLFFALIFTGCYEPSPLYGSWADNDGNKISFVSDGTFVAMIKDSTDKNVTYTGEYTVIDNVLVFSYSSSKESESGTYSSNTEWDIRGSMLYLYWTYSDSALNATVTKKLTLYHTSR